MICPLCGYEYDETNMACHAACPMSDGCAILCCPNCGYQVVDESKSLVARGLERVWPSRRSPMPRRRTRKAGVPLTHVPAGKGAEVLSLDGMPPSRLSRLTAFGLAPGSTVSVVQHRPVPVVKVGETEVALSKEILDQIRVVVEGPA